MRKRSFVPSLFKGRRTLTYIVGMGLLAALWTRTPAVAFDNNVWTFPFSGTGASATRLAYINNTGAGMALVGRANSGVALYGSSATGTGVSGDATTATGYGMVGYNYANSGLAVGIYGVTYSSGGFGVVGRNLSGGNAGVQGVGVTGVQANGQYYGVYSTASSYSGTGVVGQAMDTAGLGMMAQGGSIGIQAIGNGAGLSPYGAVGSITGAGGFGVAGYGGTGASTGVYGRSSAGTGVLGVSDSGFAGYFNGPVSVSGTLYVSGTIYGGSKSFRIDDPRDPAHKYLEHTCVESSEMKNVYDGIAIMNSDGEADVQMPSYCQTLNEDFRYQLTAVGASAPDLYIAKEIEDNRFRIAGGKPGIKVCWQVTGNRHDPYAEANPLTVEKDKTGKERGHYLHPELYGKSPKMGINAIAPPSHAPAVKMPAPLPTGAVPAPPAHDKVTG
jgi:hypothetical protein